MEAIISTPAFTSAFARAAELTGAQIERLFSFESPENKGYLFC